MESDKMNNEEILKRIEPIEDTIRDYIPDLLVGDNLKNIAKMHSIEIETHVVGSCKEKPDYFLFELKPTKTGSEMGKLYLERCFERVIDLIYSQLYCLYCCNDNVNIVDIDDDDYTYARIKADGHYHS